MPLWDKLKHELDRAGQVAQGAIDEGRVRLDVFRARQLADKAAQALGYAVYHTRQRGQEIDADTYARLSSTLAGHEAEAARLEELLATKEHDRKGGSSDVPPDAGASSTSQETPAS